MSLSKDVFELRSTTEVYFFRSMAVVLPTFSSTSTRVKEDSNANLAASRHIKRENSLFPVDLHR